MKRGERAIGIDTAAKTVSLASGGNVGYDKLLIATGSRPMALSGHEFPQRALVLDVGGRRSIHALAKPGANIA